MQEKFPKLVFLLSAVFFVIALAAFIFSLRVVSQKSEMLQQAELTWQTEMLKRNEVERLGKLIKALESERASLDSHFTVSSDVVPFLDTIEKLAAAVSAQAEVSSVDIAKDNSSLAVGIKASGSFGALYKFITLLENSPFQLEFLSMDLQNAGGAELAGSTKTLQWDLTLKVGLLNFLPK